MLHQEDFGWSSAVTRRNGLGHHEHLGFDWSKRLLCAEKEKLGSDACRSTSAIWDQLIRPAFSVRNSTPRSPVFRCLFITSSSLPFSRIHHDVPVRLGPLVAGVRSSGNPSSCLPSHHNASCGPTSSIRSRLPVDDGSFLFCSGWSFQGGG